MANRPEPDRKSQALGEHGALNPRPEWVSDELFRDSDFFDPRDLVQVKYEMLRRVQRDGDSVSDAVRAFGFSRPTFYHAAEALTREGLAGLLPKRRGPKAGHKLTEPIMDFLEQARAEDPSLRSSELAERLREEFGLLVHPRSIERALARREKKRRRSRERRPL
jgi:transposase